MYLAGCGTTMWVILCVSSFIGLVHLHKTPSSCQVPKGDISLVEMSHDYYNLTFPNTHAPLVNVSAYQLSIRLCFNASEAEYLTVHKDFIYFSKNSTSLLFNWTSACEACDDLFKVAAIPMYQDIDIENMDAAALKQENISVTNLTTMYQNNESSYALQAEQTVFLYSTNFSRKHTFWCFCYVEDPKQCRSQCEQCWPTTECVQKPSIVNASSLADASSGDIKKVDAFDKTNSLDIIHILEPVHVYTPKSPQFNIYKCSRSKNPTSGSDDHLLIICICVVAVVFIVVLGMGCCLWIMRGQLRGEGSQCCVFSCCHTNNSVNCPVEREERARLIKDGAVSDSAPANDVNLSFVDDTRSTHILTGAASVADSGILTTGDDISDMLPPPAGYENCQSDDQSETSTVTQPAGSSTDQQVKNLAFIHDDLLQASSSCENNSVSTTRATDTDIHETLTSHQNCTSAAVENNARGQVNPNLNATLAYQAVHTCSSLPNGCSGKPDHHIYVVQDADFIGHNNIDSVSSTQTQLVPTESDFLDDTLPLGSEADNLKENAKQTFNPRSKKM